MADPSVVYLGGHSQEQVAYMLMERIAHSEKKSLYGTGAAPDRKWILETYAECLATVQIPGTRFKPK